MSAKMLLKSSLHMKYLNADEYDVAPPAIPSPRKMLRKLNTMDGFSVSPRRPPFAYELSTAGVDI